MFNSYNKTISSLILVLLLFSTITATQLNVQFNPNHTEIYMESCKSIEITVFNASLHDILNYKLISDNHDVANVKLKLNENCTQENCYGIFNVTGVFLGQTNIYFQLNSSNDMEDIDISNKLTVTVIRAEKLVDELFNGSLAIFLSLMFINFGAALDISQLQIIFSKPIGPVIGFFSQFLVMPVISYILGLILFPESPALQLGLFFMGVSPGGGASNVWTCILNANMNLSIAMTTISTFAAFVMIPLWIFTLGSKIFKKGNLIVPYSRIGYITLSLTIPLGIGMLIKKYIPNVGKFLVKILKPFSIFAILILVFFAIFTNLYLLKLFTWQIAFAGLGLPWLGYTLGYTLAKVFKQNSGDSLAIAIETGIQNTGIAIFLLHFSLPQPEADLTTIVPVSVSIMTQFPLMLLYIIQKINDKKIKFESIANNNVEK